MTGFTLADLEALSDPGHETTLLDTLVTVEVGKHRLLLELARRKTGQLRPGRTATSADMVLARLAHLEHTAPDAARRLLSSPRTGAWAYHTVQALNRGAEPEWSYLAELVAGPSRPSPRLCCRADDLVLDVPLRHDDPYLARCGLRGAEPAAADVLAWSRIGGAAWHLLVRHHWPTALGIARMIRTIVPLPAAPEGRPAGATSGRAFGAIALAPAERPALFAEALVHEYQHVVLGAVMDAVPLTRPSEGRRFYVPWREDARPVDALIQGAFAFHGVTAYWRTQRHHAEGGERWQGDLLFARWRRSTLGVLDTALRSGLLTSAGTALAEGMRGRLALWCKEPVGPDAEAEAARLAEEHRRGWQERNA
ncbi:aKG-HExxH-type peptide beta-hydroxylase [Nonomuraea gerenzanensis]|uniref:Transcriptional regulator n=1 Tax=Nonomuraea gerenzanensis TaxID=93944 RepID=A0A1M4ECC4_9ACTN|nr:HEXXH motif-containing putative peptide modification protein [Nonomuraea gerenzanensis]UBU18571.1 hypothetical protein LCN96_27180 [Nonomuraea gerenzanensis]SBO96414.1 Transcriptional regulator [Nonomuraea gerenzanensis]